ncbi:MAG: hypothetical protein WB699_01605 [Bacteroidota bacterium]
MERRILGREFGYKNLAHHVASHSLNQLDWKNSVRLGGDVVDEVRRLKGSDGPAKIEPLPPEAPSDAELVRRKKLAVEGSGISRTPVTLQMNQHKSRTNSVHWASSRPALR